MCYNVAVIFKIMRCLAALVAIAAAIAVATACSGSDTQVSSAPDAPTSHQATPSTSATPALPKVVEGPWEILTPEPGFDFSPVVVPVWGDPDREYDCGSGFAGVDLVEGDEIRALDDDEAFIVVERDGTDVHVRVAPDSPFVGGVVNGTVPFLVPLEADGTRVDDIYVDEFSGTVDKVKSFTLCVVAPQEGEPTDIEA